MAKRTHTFAVELHADEGDDVAGILHALTALIEDRFHLMEPRVKVIDTHPQAMPKAVTPYGISSRGAKQFNLRMPPAIHSALEEIAAANGRSLNSELVYRLIKSLEADGFKLPDTDEEEA